MDKRVKISIIDSDLKRLTVLLLWLDQFHHLEVRGELAAPECNMPETLPIDSHIVLISQNALHMSSSLIERTLKLGALRPALILLNDKEPLVETPSIFDGEVRIDMDASLKDLYDQIENVARGRKLMVAPTWLPAAKAS